MWELPRAKLGRDGRDCDSRHHREQQFQQLMPDHSRAGLCMTDWRSPFSAER
ncbi:MAG: hypothetical protein GDA56_16235 [Hormoscilla sp. GM7CHS1pb]|nr:hypothetical protein [Hormoscilla sp. GM7CHS1pb]